MSTNVNKFKPKLPCVSMAFSSYTTTKKVSTRFISPGDEVRLLTWPTAHINNLKCYLVIIW